MTPKRTSVEEFSIKLQKKLNPCQIRTYEGLKNILKDLRTPVIAQNTPNFDQSLRIYRGILKAITIVKTQKGEFMEADITEQYGGIKTAVEQVEELFEGIYGTENLVNQMLLKHYLGFLMAGDESVEDEVEDCEDLESLCRLWLEYRKRNPFEDAQCLNPS